MTKQKRIKNPLRIGKALAAFHLNAGDPCVTMDLKAVEEKAERISKILGVPLSPEDVALFTFVHEMQHYAQWKEGRVTTADMSTPNFNKTEKSKLLEVEADEAAANFVKKAFGLGKTKKWSKRTLLAMIGAEKTLTIEQARDLGIIS